MKGEATVGNPARNGVRAGDPAAPLFLVGVPRSGTTLLYKLLCLHPEVAYISNWMRIAPGVPALALVNRLTSRFPDSRRTVWFGAGRDNAYVNGAPMPWRQQLFPRPVEGEPLYRHCGIDLPEPAGRPDPGRLHRLPPALDAMRRYDGGRLFISKYLAINHHIPALAELFPGARFVNIVRDGRAVAYSLSRVHWWPHLTIWWYGGPPAAGKKRAATPGSCAPGTGSGSWPCSSRGWRPSRRRGGSISATRSWSPSRWPPCDGWPLSPASPTAVTGWGSWPGCGTRTGTSAGIPSSNRRRAATSRPSSVPTSADSGTSADLAHCRCLASCPRPALPSR